MSEKGPLMGSFNIFLGKKRSKNHIVAQYKIILPTSVPSRYRKPSCFLIPDPIEFCKSLVYEWPDISGTPRHQWVFQVYDPIANWAKQNLNKAVIINNFSLVRLCEMLPKWTSIHIWAFWSLNFEDFLFPTTVCQILNGESIKQIFIWLDPIWRIWFESPFLEFSFRMADIVGKLTAKVYSNSYCQHFQSDTIPFA